MSPFKRWSLIPRCLSEGRAQWFIFQWQNDYVWLPILGCKRHLFPRCSLCWGSHCYVLRALEQPTERFRCCKWQCSGVICYDTMDNQYMVFLRLSLWYFKKIHTVYPAVKLGSKGGFRFHLCNPLNHSALSSGSYLHLYVKCWVQLRSSGGQIAPRAVSISMCALDCGCSTCYPTYPLSISQKCISISRLLMAVLLLSLSTWSYTVGGSFTFILMGCQGREEMNDCN